MVTITRKRGNRLIHPGIRLEEVEAAMPYYPAGVYGIEDTDGVEIAEAKVSGGKYRLYVQGRPATVVWDELSAQHVVLAAPILPVVA